MNSIIRATKYQLTMFIPQSLLCISIIVLNILISITVSYLFPGSGISAGSSDSVAIIWIFIIGLISFTPSFKFMLSNSVSRKSLFWANIISMSILSVALATVVTILLWLVSRMNIKIIVLYTLIYKNNSVIGIFIWLIGVFFLLIILGWFINMVYYRSSKGMAYVISFSPFILSGLIIIINLTTNGKLFDYIIKFIVTAMGFSGSIPNPYVGALSMLIFAAIICIFNYLLIRKAEIKG